MVPGTWTVTACAVAGSAMTAPTPTAAATAALRREWSFFKLCLPMMWIVPFMLAVGAVVISGDVVAP